MLSIYILEKRLWIFSTLHFVYDFSMVIFFMLYPGNWPNLIAWLSLLLEIFGNMYIAIVFFSGCDAVTLEINFIFLSKPYEFWEQK